MRILVLGCGEMGEAAIADLARYGRPDAVVVGARDPDKARRVVARAAEGAPKVTVERIDVADAPALRALMQGFDAVVNCIGPNYKHELAVARAAIGARVSLVDLNDEFETTLAMLELDAAARQAGIAIVMGLGASPGVTNVLVRAAANQLDVVEEIETAWVMSGPDPGGPALSYHLLYSLSGRALTWDDGALVEVRSFVDGRRRVEFPAPVGGMDVFHVGHPEPITLHRSFPSARRVTDRASFNPPEVNGWIRHLGRLARQADGPIAVGAQQVEAMDLAAACLHHACKAMDGVSRDGALLVEVAGTRGGKRRKLVFSSAGRLANGTGIPAAIGAVMLAQGKIAKTGVLPPEDCIEPDDFLYELFNRRDVGKLNGWIEE